MADLLRKDLAFLFERYFYLLEGANEIGCRGESKAGHLRQQTNSRALWRFWAPPTLLVRVVQEMLLEEEDRGVELVVDVAFFAEAVAFVFAHEVPGLVFVGAQGGDHLFGFA